MPTLIVENPPKKGSKPMSKKTPKKSSSTALAKRGTSTPSKRSGGGGLARGFAAKGLLTSILATTVGLVGANVVADFVQTKAAEKDPNSFFASNFGRAAIQGGMTAGVALFGSKVMSKPLAIALATGTGSAAAQSLYAEIRARMNRPRATGVSGFADDTLQGSGLHMAA